MSTALDGDTAQTNDIIILVWGYGATEVDTDLGTSSADSLAAAITDVCNQQSGLALMGSVVADAGASGALYAAAQFSVPASSSGQSYLQLFAPFESIGGVGDLGSTAGLYAGNYQGSSQQTPSSVVAAIAQADPGAVSTQLSALLASALAAAAPITQALSTAATYALAAGTLVVLGLFAYAQSKKR